MVVTRKTPLVPPPPGSGSNSSQGTPRVAKGKAQAILNGAVEDSLGAGLSTGSGNSDKSGSSDTVSLIRFYELLQAAVANCTIPFWRSVLPKYRIAGTHVSQSPMFFVWFERTVH